MRRLRLPRTSATKATPQASLSFAGSYRPVADGTAENGTAAGAGWLDMSLPSSADARASERGHGRGRRPGPVVKGGYRRARAGTGSQNPSGGDRWVVIRGATLARFRRRRPARITGGSVRSVHRRNTGFFGANTSFGASTRNRHQTAPPGRSWPARTSAGTGAAVIILTRRRRFRDLSGTRPDRCGGVGRGLGLPRAAGRRPADLLPRPPALPHQVGHREQPDDHGGEDVEPDAEEVLGRVGAQQLDPHAPGAVGRHVERERPPVREPEAPVGPDHEGGRGQVPQRLVEERGVERAEDDGVSVRAGHGVAVLPSVDPQRPRQVGAAAVELVVEPVAQPADGLGDQQAGRQRVGERRKRDALATAGDPRPHATQGDRAPDPEATLPDGEGTQRMAARTEVRRRRRDHVVQPATDDAEGHRPGGDVQDVARSAAAGDPAPLGDHPRGDDPGDDAQRVRPDRQRPDLPDALRGAGDGGEDHAGTLARTPPASSAASRPTAAAPARSPSASRRARTNADPTMTPSAKAATSAAWVPSETPRPTHTARPGATSRVRATSFSAASLTVARVPVTPIVEAAYTNPRQAAAVERSRAWVEDGATRKTRSRSA